MFADMIVGTKERLGAYRFEEADIIAFARLYDPQPFHIDPIAAARGPYGGIIASGWHTGAIYMALVIEHRKREAAVREAKGLPALAMGPSPGFTNLRWIKPVRPGDTLTYWHEVTGKRALASRPGWGMMFALNTAENQNGELVFSFEGKVMVPMG